MIITINGGDISLEEFHKVLAQKFQFPDYYGGHADALYECLTDLADASFNAEIFFTNFQAFRAKYSQADGIKAALEQAEKDFQELPGEFLLTIT